MTLRRQNDLHQIGAMIVGLAATFDRGFPSGASTRTPSGFRRHGSGRLSATSRQLYEIGQRIASDKVLVDACTVPDPLWIPDPQDAPPGLRPGSPGRRPMQL